MPFRPVSLVEPPTPDDSVPEATRSTTFVTAARALGRVLVPAFAVTVCVSVAGSDHGGRLTGWGLVAGIAYCMVVAGSAGLLRRGGPGAVRSAPLAAVNGAAGMVILPLLYLVSRNTSVLVTSGHVVRRVPVAAAVAGPRCARRCGSLVRQASAASPPRPTRYVTSRPPRSPTLSAAGSSSCSSRHWPGPLDTIFFGFDQAQSFTTARLTFGHGLFPWRDFYLIHGVFADILAGQLGLSVFSASRWGARRRGSRSS